MIGVFSALLATIFMFQGYHGTPTFNRIQRNLAQNLDSTNAAPLVSNGLVLPTDQELSQQTEKKAQPVKEFLEFAIPFPGANTLTENGGSQKPKLITKRAVDPTLTEVSLAPSPQTSQTAVSAQQLPQTSVPAQQVPQTSVPAQQAPQPLVPAQQVPQTSVPAQQAPKPLVPAQQVPQTSVPAQQAPQPLVPTQQVSQTSVPSQQAPQPLVPAQQVPQTSVLAQQAPQPLVPTQQVSQTSVPSQPIPQTPNTAPQLPVTNSPSQANNPTGNGVAGLLANAANMGLDAAGQFAVVGDRLSQRIKSRINRFQSSIDTMVDAKLNAYSDLLKSVMVTGVMFPTTAMRLAFAAMHVPLDVIG